MEARICVGGLLLAVLVTNTFGAHHRALPASMKFKWTSDLCFTYLSIIHLCLINCTKILIYI